jgi:autotransporter-associated beta strand protein
VQINIGQANLYWKGGLAAGSQKVWSAANWATDSAGASPTPTIPSSIYTLYLSASNAGATDQTGMTLGANLSVMGVHVTAANPSTLLDVGGYTLTTGGTGIMMAPGAGAFTIDPLILLSVNQTWSQSGVGALTVANVDTGGYTLTVSGTSSTLVTGSVSGTGALTKTGAGKLTLSGTSTYTGATTVSVGSVNVQNSSGLGSTAGATTVAAGAALQLQGGIAVGAEALTLNGTGVSLDGALRNISGTNSYGGLVTLGSATRINSDAGALTLSGGITATNLNLTIGGAGDTTLSGVLGLGAGTLTKDGGGMLTLSAANTYTGATTVSVGTLNIQNATGLGSTAGATTVAAGAALQLQGGIAVGAEALTLNGTGVSTDGALRNISGTNSYAGAVTLGSSSRINSDAGAVTLSGWVTATNLNLTIGGAGDTTLSGVLGLGAGTVTKDGVGTLTLSNANTYTGATTVSAGTLNIQNATALGTTAGGVTVTAGAALQLQGGIAVGAEALTMNGAGVSADGALRSISGANSYAGVVTLASASRINADAGLLTLSGGITATNQNLTIGGTGDTTLSGVVGLGSGTLTKDGVGKLTLSVANTYTGATTVSVGTLNIQNATALGSTAGATTVAAGAALQLQGGIAVGAEALTLNGTGVNVDGALRSVGGANSYAGAISLGSTSRINIDVGDLTLSGGISALNFDLSIGGAGNTTLSGVVGLGSGSLTKDGVGTLTLSSVNTYTGATTVSAGTLNIQNAAGLGDTAGATTVTAGAALQLQGGIAVGAEALTLNGTGVSADGALRNISGTNSYAGAVTLGSASRIHADSGALTLSGGITASNVNLTIGGAGDTKLSGVVRLGTGALTKDGVGMLTLSAANTYTGATTVSAGTLNIQNAAALGDTSGATTVTAGAALQLQGGIAIGAEALTLHGTGVSADGALRNISGTNSYAGVVTLGSASQINSDAGALTLSGAITATNLNLEIGGAGDTTLSGVLGLGSGALTKTGAGKLTLSGASTYTGVTTVSVGTVNVQHSAGLGSTAGATTVASGAALQLQGGIAVGAEALTLNGTGVSADGALRNISGTNSYAGAVTLGSASRINSDAGALTLSGGITATNLDLTIGGAGDTVLSGVLGLGAGNLTKDGVGILTLGGANTYTGVTTVSVGALNVQHAAGLGTVAGGVTVTAGAALQLQGGIAVGAEALTLSGTGVSADGALRNISGMSSYAGAVTLGSASRIEAYAGALTLSGGITATNLNLAIGGAGDTTLSGVVALGSGALTKDGAGMLTLSGANTYTGATTVNAGTLNIQNAAGLGDTAGATTVTAGAALQLEGGIAVGAEALTLHGNGVNTDGALRSVSGVNSYAGVISLGSTARINTDTGTLALSGGIAAANYNLSFGGAGDTNVSGVVSLGSGGITKDGTGKLTLSNAGSFGGDLAVNGGVLEVVALNPAAVVSVQTGGRFNFAPGSAGILSVAALSLASGGTIGMSWDSSIIASGAASLSGGTFKFSLAGNYSVGTTYTLLQGGPLSSLSAGTYGILNGQAGRIFTFTVDDGFVKVTPEARLLYWKGGSPSNERRWDRINWTVDLAGTTGVADVPDANDIAVFSAANAGAANQIGMTLGANVGVQGINVTTASPATLLDEGFSLTLGSIGISLAPGAGAFSIAPAVVVAADQTWDQNGAGLLTVANVDTGVHTLTVGGTSNTLVTGPIIGVGALTKIGAGKLTLTGASTYSGLTTISAGSLEIGNGGTTGTLLASTASSGGIVNEGMLVFNRSDTIIQGMDFPKYLTGSGGILKLGTGTVELNGKFTNESDATGTYRTILGDVSVAEGTLQYDQRPEIFYFGDYPSQSGRLAGSLSVASGATFKVIGSYLPTTLTLRGAVLGSGRIEVGDNAELKVGGDASAFTGGFLLSSSGNAAVLNLLPNGSSGSPQAALFNAPVLLGDTQSSLTLSPIGADITVNGTISGVGGISTHWGSTGVVRLTGLNTYTGDTTVGAGTLDASFGALAGTGMIEVEGGSLRAVDFNPSAVLWVRNDAVATVSGSGLSLGEMKNESSASVGLSFTSGSGTITLGTLSGSGVTAFGSNATVTGWVDQGTLSVVGLLTANIRNLQTVSMISDGDGGLVPEMVPDGDGGSIPRMIALSPVITAASVVSGTIDGGSLTLIGAGRASTVGVLSGGTVNLSAGTLSVASSGVSGGSAKVSLVNGTTLNFTPLSAGTLNVAALSLSSGGTFGMSWGSKVVASGAATLSGGTFNLSLSGSYTNGQTYTLLEGGVGSLLNAGTYRLLDAGSATYEWNITSSLVQITIQNLQTSFYWLGGGISGAEKVWSAANWARDLSATTPGPQSPSGSYMVNFSANSASAGSQLGMTLGADVSVLGISVTTASPSTLLDDGYTLTTGAGGMSLASGAGAFSIAPAIALAADQSWINSGTGTLTVSGSIATAGKGLEIGGSGATMLSGAINGAGSVSKIGGGSLGLTGANTYTGATSVSAGLLTAARGAFGRTSSLSITGGTVLAVDLNDSAPLSVAAGAMARFSGANLNLGTVSNSGNLEFLALAGVGTLSVLDGAATGVTTFLSSGVVSRLSTQGLTHVAGGTLMVRETVGSVGGFTVDSGAWVRFEKTARLGSVLANGLVTVISNSSIDRLTGAGTVSSTGTLSLGSGNYTGQLQVPTTLIKEGAGALYLSSPGQSIPFTQVESGSLLLSATNLLATSGTLLVKGAATFGVITGGSQTLQKVTVENGATIGVEGYTGELRAYDMTLGSGTYLMTPVRLRAGTTPVGAADNFGIEGITFGESKVLQGLGRDMGDSRGNSFDKFMFNLDGQSTGAVAQLGGTAYTDTLVLNANSGGTLRLQGDANITHISTLVVGDASSSSVKLEVGAYQGGTLRIGGYSMAAPVAQVLKGNGTIIGDIIFGPGAVVKPGNSPGPLSFVGNVIAMPGSELQFEYTANTSTIAGSGPNDTIAITGSLRAQGGIVAVAYDPNGKPRVTDFEKHTFDIMTYTVGTVSGIDGSVPSYLNSGGTLRQSAMILASVSSGTVGLIQMSVQRLRFASLGDGNIKKLGEIFDSKLSLSSGPISNFIDTLDSQSSLGAVRALLEGVSPGPYSELPNVVFGRLKGLQIGLSGRLSALALGSLYGPEPSERGLNLWSTTYGTLQRLNADREAGAPGYSGNHYGNVSGVERKTGALTLGVSAALGGSNVSFGEGLGSLIAETWHGGAYASVLIGDVAFDASASFGAAENTLKRSSALNSQPVKSRNTEWLTQVGLSWALNPGPFILTPSLHFVSLGYNQSEFSESGGGLLETKVIGNAFIRNALQTGLQAARLFTVKGHPVRLSTSANWMQYLDSRRHATDAMFSGMADSSFTIQSSKVGADSMQFGVAAEMALTRRTTLRLNAQSEIQSNQKTTTGNATFSWEF